MLPYEQRGSQVGLPGRGCFWKVLSDGKAGAGVSFLPLTFHVCMCKGGDAVGHVLTTVYNLEKLEFNSEVQLPSAA